MSHDNDTELKPLTRDPLSVTKLRSGAIRLALMLLLTVRATASPDETLGTLPNGAAVNIDGFDRKARVLCEVYAHVGKTR